MTDKEIEKETDKEFRATVGIFLIGLLCFWGGWFFYMISEWAFPTWYMFQALSGATGFIAILLGLYMWSSVKENAK